MLDEIERLGMHVMRLAHQLVVDLSETPENAPVSHGATAATQRVPIRAQRAAASAAFYRIARFVRDTIKLHVSLAAGEIPPLPRASLPRVPLLNDMLNLGPLAPANPSPTQKADPRMEPVAAYLVAAAKAAPRGRCKPGTINKIPQRLQETIEADPGLTLTGAQIALKLCKEFHLPYNIAKMNQDPILSRSAATPPPAPEQATGPP